MTHSVSPLVASNAVADAVRVEDGGRVGGRPCRPRMTARCTRMRYLLEVTGDRQSEFAVGQSPCRDPCVLEDGRGRATGLYQRLPRTRPRRR